MTGNHPLLATCYDSIGLIYSENKKYKEAFDNLEEALKIRIRLFGELHLEVAHSYNNLGLVLYSLKSAQALLNFQKAISVTKKLFPEGHPLLVTLCNNAAFASYNKGNNKYTLQCFCDSLRLYIKYYNERNSPLGELYEKIGAFLIDQRLYDQAINMLKKAILIYVKLPGKYKTRMIKQITQYVVQSEQNMATNIRYENLEIL